MIVSLQTTSRSLGLALACTLLALANEVRAADLVLPQAKPVKLAGDFKFTEGPAVSANGDVYFTDIPNNRIHKWSASNKELSIFAEETNGANGLYFADDGRLFACQGNAKRVVAYSIPQTEMIPALWLSVTTGKNLINPMTYGLILREVFIFLILTMGIKNSLRTENMFITFNLEEEM